MGVFSPLSFVMKKIQIYLLRSFLLTVFTTSSVLILLFMSFSIFNVTSLLASGADFRLVLTALLENMTFLLSLIIPISLLLSSLLCFNRLSETSQVIAMRACGISFWRIVRVLLLVSMLMFIFCCYLQNEKVPESSHSRKKVRASIGLFDMISAMEPGKTYQQGDFSIIMRKKDRNVLKDVSITKKEEDGSLLNYVADEARLEMEDNNTLLIRLYNCSIYDESKSYGNSQMDYLPLRYQTKEKEDESIDKRRVKDKYTWELIKDIYIAEKIVAPKEEVGKRNLRLSKTELSKRFVLGFSCFCFVLVGVPLGIKNSRKEDEMKTLWKYLTAIFLYGLILLFTFLVDSLAKRNVMFSEYIPLIPVLVTIIVGVFLVKKND